MTDGQQGFRFLEPLPALGPVDFVYLTAHVKSNEVWHLIDGNNCFLLL